MALSSREIKEILAVLEDSGWDEAEVTIGDVTLAVSRGSVPEAGPPPAGATPAPSTSENRPAPQPPAPAPAAAAAPSEPAGHVVAAPSVGVFWRAPEPGAPPFVDVGAEVEEGQTLCIVEVMKLMQHVTADVAGVIAAIHVENGDHVEFGTPLFSIASASA